MVERVAQPSVPAASATAVWFPAARRVELREETLEVPGPADVQVRALFSAISHGTEMLVYRGQVPGELPLDLPTLRGSFGFPIKYGYANVGCVEVVGSEVTGLKPGDIVFVHHPHQDRYVVPASAAHKLPDGLDPEKGVFAANVETAVNVILDAAIRLGERVVIFGQGVVGLLLTQLARRAGAGLVVSVDPIPRRRELSLRLGADAALAPEEGLPAEIRRLWGGQGADIAIEVSGNALALGQAIDSVAFQGTVVVASWYGTRPVSLLLGGAFHRGRLRIVSSQVSNVDPALQPRWSRERRFELAISLLRDLELEALITQRVPFKRAAEAFELLDTHPDETVQVVLTYG